MLFLPLLLRSAVFLLHALVLCRFSSHEQYSPLNVSLLACPSPPLSFFFSFALPLSFASRCPPEVVDVPCHLIIFFALRANLVHLRYWIEYVFQLSSRFETVAPASLDNGSRFSGGVYNNVRMQGFVVRCLHDVCACCGCCVKCVASSSFCPFQRCRAACLSGAENSIDSVAPVVISVASELLDPDIFSCEELLLLQRCHVLLFCHDTGPLCFCCVLLRSVRSFIANAPLPCKWWTRDGTVVWTLEPTRVRWDGRALTHQVREKLW